MTRLEAIKETLRGSKVGPGDCCVTFTTCIGRDNEAWLVEMLERATKHIAKRASEQRNVGIVDIAAERLLTDLRAKEAP